MVIDDKIEISVTELDEITLRDRVISSIEMVKIPDGYFLYSEEKERQYLSAFKIMKNPVTVAQYRHFCIATKREMPKMPVWDWHDTHPIVNANWYEATAFAEWIGLALPTDIEWEKAARGTDGREFPWGNDWDENKCCNLVGKSVGQTSPVGSYPWGNSPYGVQDMAGNVWEWCDSLNVETKKRVLRGGCWNNGKVVDYFRIVSRIYCYSATRGNYLGFRCILRSPVIDLKSEE